MASTDKNTFYPKTNSQSPIEEQLAEIRSMATDPIAIVRCDKRKDPGIFWKPVEYDPRFPNIDVTRWCVASFIDYYRCRKLRGPDYEPCEYFKNTYTQVCPDYMIERWENDRANGAFLPNV